jgi:predicted enzyme related to lactoylglutathione lyase
MHSIPPLPRLRQVALLAGDGPQASRHLRKAFGWPDPFHDPGVGEFGLANSVFAAGDTFVEVVSPVREGTTAARYLARRGGDTGYMAIFQVDDVAAARRRVEAAGLRIVWQADRADIAGTNLHPKDVPGAIVSLDWADPPESWRWAGPDWTGRSPVHSGPLAGSIGRLTIEVRDPMGAAERWAQVLGVSRGSEATIELAGGAQLLRFVPVTGDRGEGIVEIALHLDGAGQEVTEICGVRFVPVQRLRASR